MHTSTGGAQLFLGVFSFHEQLDIDRVHLFRQLGVHRNDGSGVVGLRERVVVVVVTSRTSAVIAVAKVDEEVVILL